MPVDLELVLAADASGSIDERKIRLQRECSGCPVNDDLEARFAREIIGGPGSFVVTVDERTSFAEAVRRKLLLEIAGGALPPRAG